MAEKFVPLREQVVVSQIEADGRTKGGVYVPASKSVILRRGKVVAVGTARYYPYGTEPLQVVVGDIVTYPEGAGFELSIEDETLRILPETSILAVIKEETNG